MGLLEPSSSSQGQLVLRRDSCGKLREVANTGVGKGIIAEALNFEL